MAEPVNSSHGEPLQCWNGDPAAAAVMETACVRAWKARCFLLAEDQLKASVPSHKFVPWRIADGSRDSLTSETQLGIVLSFYLACSFFQRLFFLSFLFGASRATCTTDNHDHDDDRDGDDMILLRLFKASVYQICPECLFTSLKFYKRQHSVKKH